MAQVAIVSDSKFPVNRKRIRAAVERVLSDKGVSSDVEVSIAIVGDRKMTALHQKYKGEPGTTDVLSFGYSEHGGSDTKGFVDPQGSSLLLGDIVVSYPQVIKQAIEENKLVDDKIDFLVEHGMLHLLGYHHE